MTHTPQRALSPERAANLAENPYAGQGPVLLDIGGDIGAVVLHLPAHWEGAEVEYRARGRRPGRPRPPRTRTTTHALTTHSHAHDSRTPATVRTSRSSAAPRAEASHTPPSSPTSSPAATSSPCPTAPGSRSTSSAARSPSSTSPATRRPHSPIGPSSVRRRSSLGRKGTGPTRDCLGSRTWEATGGTSPTKFCEEIELVGNLVVAATASPGRMAQDDVGLGSRPVRRGRAPGLTRVSRRRPAAGRNR